MSTRPVTSRRSIDPCHPRAPWLGLAAVVVLLGGSRPATAQNYGPAPSYGSAGQVTVGTNAHEIAVADLDGNGTLDFVVANNGANTVSVMMGNGSGGFATAPGSPIAVGMEPVGVAVGLLDADADLDIAVANFASNNVTVLLGDGSGGFAAATGSPFSAGATATGCQGVAIATITNDAFNDLVVTNETTSEVLVLAGDGTGVFSAPTPFAVGPGPRGLAVADLNADGRNDVLVANYNLGNPTTSNLSVLLGNVSGGLDTAVPYATSGTGARGVGVGDFNRDGKLDVALANRVADNVSLLLGNGDGTLQAAVNYAAGEGPFGLAVGDFNIDGKLDVAVANFDGSGVTAGVRILNGDGAGTLQSPGTLFNSATFSNPIFVGAGDFDGDGKPDLAVPNFGGNFARVFLNTLVVSADVGITNSGPATVLAGEDVVYTITVTNNGPNLAASSSVVDVTPAGLTFVSNTGACLTAFPCALGTLAGGDVRTITSTFTVSPGQPDGALSNTADVTSTTADPDSANNSATASTTVSASADLSITNLGPANVVAGQDVVYTITVTNGGPSNAVLVSVADPAPVGLTFVSNAGDCTSSFPCGLTTLAPGAVRTITSTYTVPPSYAGANPILTTATVGSLTADPDALDNSATASTAVSFSADLRLTKTGPATVVAGQNLVYTITVTNDGPSDAAAVSVADTPPAGLTFVSNTGACTGAFPCGLGTLAPGDVRTITSTFLVPADYAGASSIQNTATASTTTADPTPANNSASAPTTVSISADLSITKTGPANAAAGQDVVYTITVTNNGPSDAAAVSVGDTPPAGLDFVSNAGDCTAAFPCPLGTVAPGQVRTITVTFEIPVGYSGPAAVQNVATVGSTTADPVPGDNSASAPTTIGPPSADLSATKAGPANVKRGNPLVYTITVTNNGPSPASGVELADPTPDGLTFVSNTGDCTTAFPCALGTLAAGATRTVTATFAVPADYAGPKPIVNSASVSSGFGDPESANNTASASTSVDPMAFHTVTPCRGFDTRDAGSAPALAPGPARSFTIAGACDVPNGARAVSVNITVTEPTAPGDLRLYPTGTTAPLASAINYGIGQTRANNAVIPLGTGGAIDVLCDQAAGTVHFILDVNGYFIEP